ncbi:hypothetical protein SAMN04515647_4535 [Cohaesibacter sp. ES.047]|uniref:DUF6867 family protein n=1 Tax=Cohaesibacter sp. ES.047 TaxID=1798205 RepID=UPI000BB93A9F|nr:hypothetical protein [Cohaesibacter sp. ES.047]SNY94210.1 hypothetical protein SAMN04515647_4535 [Cohaesibacter sp. ES.047]
MNFLWDNTIAAFLVLTIFLGGGAAWMSGRAIALSWRPNWQIFLYMLLLTAAVRFLNYGLYEGQLLSLYYYLVTFVILTAFCWLGYRYTRTNQMVRQYHWLYQKVSPLSWKER